MKTENKQYRLKRWYPSLHPEWKHEEITVEKTKDGNYVNFMDCQVVPKHEVENNPDFWEEVKQPLFITEDGVDKFYSNQPLWEVNKDFEKLVTTVAWVASKGSKYFSHEGNADKYIWRNKRVFSYEDMMKAKHSIILTYEDTEKAAKKRSKQ